MISLKKHSFAVLFLFGLYLSIHSSFISTASSNPHHNGVYDYQERVGEKVIPFQWKKEERQDEVIISVFEKSKSFFNLCSLDGSTNKWKMHDATRNNISAERIGNYLHITGIRGGEKYDKKIPIDDRPWYQPLSYSLGRFLNSQEKKTSFWVIRADNVEVIALTAKKIGYEVVSLAGNDMYAQKIEIRAEGFLAGFWSAKYWYRDKDNLFLRYRSVHGLPGTAETVVELVSEPQIQLENPSG